MSLTLNHGTITLHGNTKASAAVEVLTFPLYTQTPAVPLPPVGTLGTLTLKKPPYVVDRFDLNNVIDYSDGNNNNNLSMTVTKVIGPSKYNVRV